MRVVAVAEHWAAPEGLINLPSPPCHISEPTLACSSQLESRLPTALLLRELAFPVLDLRGETPVCGSNLSLRVNLCSCTESFPLIPLTVSQVST